MTKTYIVRYTYVQDITTKLLIQDTVFVACTIPTRHVSEHEKTPTIESLSNIREAAASYWACHGTGNGGVTSIEEIQNDYRVPADTKDTKIVCTFNASVEPLLHYDTLQSTLCADTDTESLDLISKSDLQASLMSLLKAEVWSQLDNLSTKNILLSAGETTVPLQEFMNLFRKFVFDDNSSSTDRLGHIESTPFWCFRILSESPHYDYASLGQADEEMANNPDVTKFGTYPPRRKSSRPRGFSEDPSAVPRTMPDFKPTYEFNRYNGRPVLPDGWRS